MAGSIPILFDTYFRCSGGKRENIDRGSPSTIKYRRALQYRSHERRKIQTRHEERHRMNPDDPGARMYYYHTVVQVCRGLGGGGGDTLLVIVIPKIISVAYTVVIGQASSTTVVSNDSIWQTTTMPAISLSK